jgi:hypothetical protein
MPALSQGRPLMLLRSEGISVAQARGARVSTMSAGHREGVKQASSLTLALTRQRSIRQYLGNNREIGIRYVTDHHGSALFTIARIVLDCRRDFHRIGGGHDLYRQPGRLPRYEPVPSRLIVRPLELLDRLQRCETRLPERESVEIGGSRSPRRRGRGENFSEAGWAQWQIILYGRLSQILRAALRAQQIEDLTANPRRP